MPAGARPERPFRRLGDSRPRSCRRRRERLAGWPAGGPRPPAGEVLEALRAYRRGIISVADDAAALRVSGIYPLDDSGAALALLEQSLPIRLDYHGPYWVSIASR